MILFKKCEKPQILLLRSSDGLRPAQSPLKARGQIPRCSAGGGFFQRIARTRRAPTPLGLFLFFLICLRGRVVAEVLVITEVIAITEASVITNRVHGNRYKAPAESIGIPHGRHRSQ